MKKIEVDPFAWEQKTLKMMLDTNFRLRIARGVGQLMTNLPFEPDQLLVHISNKLKLNDAVFQRKTTFLGKLINRLTREDPDLIILDGIAARQLFEFADKPPPNDIDINSRYEVHRDIVRMLYNRAQRRILSQEEMNA